MRCRVSLSAAITRPGVHLHSHISGLSEVRSSTAHRGDAAPLVSANSYTPGRCSSAATPALHAGVCLAKAMPPGVGLRNSSHLAPRQKNLLAEHCCCVAAEGKIESARLMQTETSQAPAIGRVGWPGPGGGGGQVLYSTSHCRAD